MDDRSAEDVLAGVLRIAVGRGSKEPRIVPTLPIAATRTWQAALAESTRKFAPEDADEWTPKDSADFASLSLDILLDVITEYDTTAALGGREWLERNADPAQLYAAASQMAQVAFPFADSPRMFLAALIARSVERPSPPSSTNGLSPTGDLTPEPSKPDSTRAS